jgi:hypothetical protein
MIACFRSFQFVCIRVYSWLKEFASTATTIGGILI